MVLIHLAMDEIKDIKVPACVGTTPTLIMCNTRLADESGGDFNRVSFELLL